VLLEELLIGQAEEDRHERIIQLCKISAAKYSHGITRTMNTSGRGSDTPIFLGFFFFSEYFSYIMCTSVHQRPNSGISARGVFDA
jgi:hypothetical protein